MDASQRVRIGAASLNLSELRFAAVSKALQPQRLPILSSGRPRGSLSLAASLSFDRVSSWPALTPAYTAGIR